MHGDKQTSDTGLAWAWSAGMAVVAGLIRLIPHPLNFTPVGALALFGGARLRSWWAAVLPLAVMAVTDLILWVVRGYSPFNPWVYGCFALTVLWGWLLLRTGSAWRIGAVSVLVSVQFFLVTNFGVWLTASADPRKLPEGAVIAYKEIPGLPAAVPCAYARNLSGLAACYIAALPFVETNAPPLGFFGNQLVGDLFYSGLLFGGYALLRRGVLLPRRPPHPALSPPWGERAG